MAEQLFAHDFGGQEAGRAIGYRVFGVERHTFGQVGAQPGEQLADAQPMFGAHGFRASKIKLSAHGFDKFFQFGLALGAVDFVHHEDDGQVFGQQADHGAVGFAETHGFHHESHHIYAAEGFGNVLVEPVVERVAVAGLEAGGVHEDELAALIGINAGDFVASGLGLFAGDADFLADEVVHQRGFAHVRPANDGHEAAAEGGWMFGVGIIHVVHMDIFSGSLCGMLNRLPENVGFNKAKM